jgi:hypothetical protein
MITIEGIDPTATSPGSSKENVMSSDKVLIFGQDL